MKRAFNIFVISGCCILIGAAAINLFMLLGTAERVIHDRALLPNTDTVIILGAGVYQDETLSPLLEARVQAALAVYQQGNTDAILISGDNSTTEYNEVIPVRDYLLEAGVPAPNIFTDFAGFDTYDSMYRARDIFEVESAVVVTQSFHLPRAIYLGNQLNIDTYGYVPSGDTVASRNYVREFAARTKAFFDVLTNAEPRFYGEPIPIDGDGRASLE